MSLSQPVIVLDLGLVVAALDAGIEGVRRVGRDFRAEQVERQRVMQVQFLLDGRQIDDAERADLGDIRGIVDSGGPHRLAGSLHHAADAGFADEHVMGFFGEHESAGARQRIEAGLGQASATASCRRGR